MPAKDRHHDIVVSALKRDGWQILNEQATLRIGRRRLWIDIRARNDTGVIIFVEIKSYEAVESPVQFLEIVLGQYLLYRAILEANSRTEDLFLAVPERAYLTILQEPIGQIMIRTYRINILVFDVATSEVLRWIKNT